MASDLQFKIGVDQGQALAALRQLEAAATKTIVTLESVRAGKGARSPELEAAYQDLQRLQGQINGLGFGTRLKAELTDFARQIPGVGRVFNALNGAAGSATAVLGTVAAAAVGAKKALTEWAAAETQIVALNAALAASGQLSRDNAIEVAKLAEKYGELTGAGGEQWRGVLAQLIRLGGVHVQELNREAAAVKNLAGLLGTDLSTAAMLYIRAINGSTESLSRYGLKLDEGLSKEEKLAQLRQKLSAGAGLLEAQTNTLSGAIGAFTRAVGDLFKWLGSVLDRGYKIREWFQWWTGAIRSIIDRLPKVELDTDGLTNNTTAADKTNKALTRLGATARALELATPAAAAATEYQRLNEQIDATLKKQLALQDAARALELATLDQQEQIALANPELSATQRSRIKAEFEQRRAQVAGRYAEQAAQAQLTTTREKARTVVTDWSTMRLVVGRAETERDNAAEAVAKAKRRTASATRDDAQTLTRRQIELEARRAQLEQGGWAVTPGEIRQRHAEYDEVKKIDVELAQIRAALKPAKDAAAVLKAAQDRLAAAEATLAAAREKEATLAQAAAEAEQAVGIASKHLATTRAAAAAKSQAAANAIAETARAAEKETQEKRDEIARLAAEAAALKAQTPEQQKAARRQQLEAELAPLRRQLADKTISAVDRNAIQSKIALAKARAEKDLAAIDARVTKTAPHEPVTPILQIATDRLRQIGGYTGGGPAGPADHVRRQTELLAAIKKRLDDGIKTKDATPSEIF